MPPRPQFQALLTQTVWARTLAGLLLSLAGLLLGWQLSESGHPRQLAASQTSPIQTSPVLPELRPAPGPQPASYGLGVLAETPPLKVLPRWRAEGLGALVQRPQDAPDLIRLGRMNLDGG